jgi:hypothetical protein
LTHYLLESKETSACSKKLLQSGGDLKSIEDLFGPIENLQTNWHAHVRELKRRLP